LIYTLEDFSKKGCYPRLVNYKIVPTVLRIKNFDYPNIKQTALLPNYGTNIRNVREIFKFKKY